MTRTYLTYRILFDCIAFVSVFVLPWWLVAIYVLFLCFYYNPFYEAIAVGMLFDAVYGAVTAHTTSFSLIYTLLFVCLFAGAWALRDLLRIYT